MLRRILKEPLLHFLMLGVVLFSGYGLLSKSDGSSSGKIIVSQGQLDSLTLLFSRTWQRLPTDEEMQGLVRDYVRDEVLYREGMARGLDRDDEIIRRRVVQKLKFVTESADIGEPSDQQLQAYLDAHPAKFATEPRWSFRLVYLDPKRREKTLSTDVEQILGELNNSQGDVSWSNLGDPTTLPLEIADASTNDIRNTFGVDFAVSLAKLLKGSWEGPITSEFGILLVEVTDRTEQRIPGLNEIRDAVKRDWELARRTEMSEAFYQNLLAHYEVTIEPAQALNSATAAPTTSR